MENYINNFESFNENIVYNFNLGDGGIGDYIKFFIYILNSCIINNKRLYYKKNNIEIENHIKLIYDIMYITDDLLQELDNFTLVNPQMFYESTNIYECNININNVFYFSNEIITNSKIIFPPNINNYISIHLRLGDKFLEIPEENIYCKEDTRFFSEEQINKTIEENMNEYILFCCDNNLFRQKIKEKYNNIIITTGKIKHTSYLTTSKKEIIDTITEFYLLTNSKKIFAASYSGFSIIASKFNNIPYTMV
jgi:hypothetical protein